MLVVIARRFAVGFSTILAVLFFSGLLLHLVPGDPVTAMMGESITATPEAMAEMRARLGLDRPIFIQAGTYALNALKGDLGITIRGNEPVAALLIERVPNTLLLATTGLCVALLLGFPLGAIAAIGRGTMVDAAILAFTVVGVSIPAFWLGLMLMQVFAVHLRLLPVAGSDLRNLVLPALTLGLTYSVVIARMTRSTLIDVLAENYIRTAQARGLRERQILTAHAIRPAIIGIVPLIGMVFAYLLGGQIIVENVFSWNGIGRLAVRAMLQRDYPLVQGFIVFFATSVVFLSMTVDILQVLLDPRIRRT